MSSKIWKTLPFRAGTSIALGASLLTILLSSFFYNRTYQGELLAADHSLAQLVATVENSAAIAAYLDNKELAAEVTRGLARNDIVSGVSLVSVTGMTVASGDLKSETELRLRHFPLASPFTPTDRVGEITIEPNQVFIEGNARQAALVHVLTMAAHSLIIVGLVIFLVHRQLTQPLKSLAHDLHGIEPGSDRRLHCPKRHKDDEIGILVNDTNQLLKSVQVTLDQERRLRSEVESLGRKYRLIFENASGGIVLTDQQGGVQLFNPSFEQIIGSERMRQLLKSAGTGFTSLFLDSQSVTHALQQAPLNRAPIALDLQLRADQEQTPPRWLHALFSSVTDEKTGGLLIECIIYDISERTQREQRTLFEAERDPLTHLFNRRAGEHRIRQAFDKAQSKGYQCALLMIDLDRFKLINDTCGHEAGDRVLVEVARRLRDSVRQDDLVIRWGGDEFLVMIKQGHGMLEALPVAKKILARLGSDIELGEGRHDSIGASIGIALFPKHGKNPDHLIELADSAMYQVKKQGKNGFSLHSAEPFSRE